MCQRQRTSIVPGSEGPLCSKVYLSCAGKITGPLPWDAAEGPDSPRSMLLHLPGAPGQPTAETNNLSQQPASGVWEHQGTSWAHRSASGVHLQIICGLLHCLVEESERQQIVCKVNLVTC